MILIQGASGTRKILGSIYLTFWLYFIATLQYASSQQELERSHWLQVPGFGLTAKVRIIQQDSSKLDEEILVREYYSNVERRSKLELTPLQGRNITSSYDKEAFSYYYNGANNQSLMLKMTDTLRGPDCKLATAQMLTEDLFGSMSKVDKHLTGEDWLRKRPDVPDYMIGFARLLVIVDSNREKLSGLVGPSPLCRNQPTVRYMLKDFLGATSEEELSQLMVYYGKSNATMEDLPLRIWFLIKQDIEIVVDYSLVAEIDYEAAATKEVEGENLFTFPLGSGCSVNLPLSRLVRQQLSPRLLSFRASIENLQEAQVELKYFIAYDGYAGMVRRDTLATGPQKSQSSITIHDLKHQVKYNIASSSYESRNNETNSTEAQFDTNESQCVVAYHHGQQHLMGEPVLPFDGMVEMGRASVRGVEVVVFELITEDLTDLLFPEVSFINRQGYNQSVYIPNLNRYDKSFCVNYYFQVDSVHTSGFWVDGRPLGQLMRIDILQQNYPLFRVEVEDFMWDLVDAPNGDRAEELFALGDRCSGDELRAEGSASLEMELKFATIAQKVPIQARDAERMLEGAPRRNRAIAEALSSQVDSSLKLTQIRDLESKFVKLDIKNLDDDELAKATTFRLMVSAKLDHHTQMIYQPMSVAKGRLRNPVRSHPAANFEECFWEAGRKFKNLRYILFAFCYMSCLIDEQATSEPGSKGIKGIVSSVFQLSEDHEPQCEVFSLKKISEHDNYRSDVWATIQQKLMGKDLILPVQQDSEENAVGELILSAKSIEISNKRWSSLNGGLPNQPEVDESVLEGMGLIVSSGTTRVEAKKPEGYNEDELPPPAMSYAVCHSSCVASFGCRSFSLCSGADQLECLISDLEFRDLDLLREIEQKAAKIGNESKSKRGSITIQVSQESEIDERAANKSLELRVDRRCHLYNKRALELFNRNDIIITTELRNKSLAPADSEEQCAELCLRRNMHYFKRSAKSSKSLYLDLDEAAVELEVGVLAKVREREERNLRSTWCSSFAFIELNAGLLPDSVRATIDSSKLTRRGLCYIPKPPRPIKVISNNEPPAAEGRILPKMQLHKRYEFSYSSIYEEQHDGLRLLAFHGNNREVDFSKLNSEQARKYITDNNDQAYVGARDLETCARLCFLQNTPVKPWCRSFGFMRYNVAEKAPSGAGQKPQYYCIFNSITTRDAKRSSMRDHILSPAPKSLQVSHYEPSEFLSLENVYLTKFYETIVKADETINSKGTFRFKTFGIMLIVLMSLSSGIVFTLMLSDRIIYGLAGPRRDSMENPSRSFLNSLVDMGDSDITHRSFEEEIVLPDLINPSPHS